MLCFVIPLKSKSVSYDWASVCKLFEASLQSAYQQTDPDFKVIAIHHEKPNLVTRYDWRVEFLEADRSPPHAGSDQITQPQYASMVKDKARKRALGMVRVGELKPDFIMFMDADDLVSCRLARFVNSNRQSNGWMLKRGYKYRYGSRFIYYDDCYNCGTNAIINSELTYCPKDTIQQETSQSLILTNGHQIIEQKMASLGYPLEHLPFPGAVNVIGHQDRLTPIRYIVRQEKSKKNRSLRMLLGRLRRTRPLNRKLKQEFNIVPNLLSPANSV